VTYLFILIGYAVLMIAFGVIFSRRVRGSGDFFVAGRELNAGLIFSTLIAANIGAGSTVGAAGLGYRDGLPAWWWVGSAGIGSLILAFTVGPRIWRIARDNNLYTVGDYLEFRYNRRCADWSRCCCGSGRWRSWPDSWSRWSRYSRRRRAWAELQAVCWRLL